MNFRQKITVSGSLILAALPGRVVSLREPLD